PATINGKRRVMVFAGGESRPAIGGLVCLDPKDGVIDFAFPWRGTRYESVNASSPLAVGNKVFVSECYGSGGALVEIGADFSVKKLWDSADLDTHFMTSVEKDGYLYGVSGHGPHDCPMVCVELATGKTMWKTEPRW